MDKLELKKKIVKICKESLENSYKTVKNTINDLSQTASEYEGDHDIFDPFKEDMMKKKDLQVEQLQKYTEDIKLLEKIDPSKISEKVEFGSVVITNKQKMFIAVALGKIIVNNDTYFAISAQVPVFKAMQDFKPGDSFTINNNTFTIKEIF